MKIIKRETYVDLETGIGIEARGPIVACNDDPKLVMAGGPTTFHYSGVYKDERPELGLACESQININIHGCAEHGDGDRGVPEPAAAARAGKGQSQGRGRREIRRGRVTHRAAAGELRFREVAGSLEKPVRTSVKQP